MTDLNDTPKLNGSSGFISYDESSFEQSFTEVRTSGKQSSAEVRTSGKQSSTETSVDYSRQNEKNHRLARRRLNGQGDTPRQYIIGTVAFNMEPPYIQPTTSSNVDERSELTLHFSRPRKLAGCVVGTGKPAKETQKKSSQDKLIGQSGQRASSLDSSQLILCDNRSFGSLEKPIPEITAADRNSTTRYGSGGAISERRTRAVSRRSLQEFTPEQLSEAQRSVNFYKQFGDFWNTFPKTDYTYSRSSPWYGDEVAPGIRRIPNMSRRSYRSPNNSNASSPVLTPPSSQSSGAGSVWNWAGYSGAVNVHEESWFQYVKRVVRTTTTTVVTRVYRTVSRSDDSLSGVGPLDSSEENVPTGLSKWFVWPLLLFLLLGIIYYCTFGSDPPVQVVDFSAFLTGVSSALCDSASAVWASVSSAFCSASSAAFRPLWFLWDSAVYFIALFFNTVLMIPSLFTPTNETLTASSEFSQSPASSEFSQSQMTWLMDTIRDIVESMDPHDFSLSPEEEDHLVDRVGVKVSKQMQELQDELDAIKQDTKATKELNENVAKRMRELQLELDAVKNDQKSTKEQHEEMEKLMKELRDEWEMVQQQDRDHHKALLATIVATHKKVEKMEEASKSSSASPGTNIIIPNDFKASVMAIVEELLEKYHADRTGKTDYALLSNGGAIASIRCTRPYKERSGEYVLWEIFNWEFVNLPDIILKPGIMPGECWAFEGANGYLAIKLSLPIHVEGFTMEHTPRELSPYGHIKSAPRKFSVWGLESLEDREETFLGRFEFLENGKSLQSYDAIIAEKPFQLVELRIESNHGHLEYTCLYRFRVHGRPAF